MKSLEGFHAAILRDGMEVSNRLSVALFRRTGRDWALEAPEGPRRPVRDAVITALMVTLGLVVAWFFPRGR
jgi:hypothetical protein